MTAITRLTRFNDRYRHLHGLPPPVRVRNPQLYFHPRSLREEQCGCGYPRVPCPVGKKYTDEEEISYRGNYCQVEEDKNRPPAGTH